MCVYSFLQKKKKKECNKHLKIQLKVIKNSNKKEKHGPVNEEYHPEREKKSKVGTRSIPHIGSHTLPFTDEVTEA